ncbi:MAG: multicopper oxidase domain-containing protein, partial [Deltaproteobacteria bacterium]|nr:multicopper oxidase domain-containing protein [Deltaproteobacteria bacterium]
PFWNPEFLGDVMVVNGRSWPVANVLPQRYRLRLLNGSNARFYNLSLSGSSTGKGKGKGKTANVAFWVIGTDGGLLDMPVQTDTLLIAPGERYDVIVDFGNVPGQTFTLMNDAKAPYPFGETADPKTVGQIAQFVVAAAGPADDTYNPATDGALRGGGGQEPVIVRLPGAPGGPAIAGNVQKVRQLTLNEIPGPFGPLAAVLNNTRWGGTREDGTPVVVENNPADSAVLLDTGTVAGVTNYLTEFPQVGSTEIWEIINLTADAHPIHLHLVQFQVVNRQAYNVKQYEREYLRNFPGGAAANPNSGFFIPFFGPPLPYNTPNADGAIGGNPAIGPFLQKAPIAPAPYEQGWKDTVIALPKQVTRIAVRWTPQEQPFNAADAGTNFFPFDPTSLGNPAGGVVTSANDPEGAGYVWHCHILDHEDNEMMRPYVPVDNADNKLHP